MRISWLMAVFFLLPGCSAHKMWFGSDLPILTFVQLNGILDENGEVIKVEMNTNSAASNPNEGKSGDPNKKHLGALIAWSPEFNAAFISKSGNGCIQPATYAKTSSGKAEIPAGVLSQAFANGQLKGDFNQVLEKLTSVSDQSTYLSIGIYGLCQMHANGGLKEEQLTELTKVLFEKAATIKGTSPGTTSPQVKAEDKQ